MFTAYVAPITLNTYTSYPIGALISTGWGRTVSYDPNSLPDLLQTVTMNTISYTQCLYGYSYIPLNTMKAPGKDTCQGDSGGPLVQNRNGRVEQVGITSYGYGCADYMYPGVYTEVSKYISWINQAKATL